jgi:hypothetical protein
VKEIERARINLSDGRGKNKVPMEVRILFKAITKEQQILFIERSRQKKPLK